MMTIAFGVVLGLAFFGVLDFFLGLLGEWLDSPRGVK
jgi:hypothetical protein